MFDTDLESLVGLSELELAGRLLQSNGWFRLRLESRLYEASSRSELADNWLAAWYLGERIAVHSNAATVYFREEPADSSELEARDGGGAEADGLATVIYTFRGIKPEAIAATLAELLPVYAGEVLGDFEELDPDEEKEAGLHNLVEDAHCWLEDRGDSATRLPDLEEAFRSDAAVAAETEDYDFA